MPLGCVKDLTGLAPLRFAPVTLENVLQGRLISTAKYLPV